jgi:hypothetical protein
MKYTITKSFMVYLFVILGLTTYGHAESDSQLPKSEQTGANKDADTITKIDKIEMISEIVIPNSSAPDIANPRLKDGVACDDEELEPAILGPDIVELPMAKTEPCSSVDCENLENAVLHKDNYKKIPMAKIIEGCD